MSYQPGAHLIASLSVAETHLLNNYQPFQVCVDQLIRQFDLQKLGEVYHNFSPAGFTAVVCLSESHLSIHTWPEHGLVNLDIYLSNFKRNNDGTVKAIYSVLRSYFNGVVVTEQTIIR